MSEHKKGKLKRTQLGSVCRAKEPGKPPYIKLSKNVTLEQGQILRLESKKFQTESLQSAVASGKMSADLAGTIQERIDKMPEWVLFEVVELKENA